MYSFTSNRSSFAFKNDTLDDDPGYKKEMEDVNTLHNVQDI